MNNEMYLILLVLFSSIPFAYSRNAPLWGRELFSRDVVIGRYHPHRSQQVRTFENRENTHNHKRALEIVDVNENIGTSHNDQNKIQNQQNQQIQIVDVNEKAADFDENKYEVQHRENREIGVNLEKSISNSQNLFSRDIITGRRIAHQNGRGSKNRIYSQNQTSEFGVADINESRVDSPNKEREVQDQQDQQMQVVDIDGNIADSNKDEYVMQHQDNREIIVDFQNKQNSSLRDVVEGKRNPSMEHDGRGSGNQVNVYNSTHELVNLDINESEVNSPNIQNGVQDRQNQEVQVVSATENVMSTEQNLQDREIINGSGNDANAPFYTVCQTVECKKLANDFISSLNKSVDPCENFYQFACSGWKVPKTKDLPPNELTRSRIALIVDSVQRDIKEILEIEPKPSDILPIKQAKKWYRSCIDTDRIERRGLKPIESILMQVGGWPMIMDEEEWDEKGYTWQSIERHYARLTGSYVFYDIAADYPAQGFTIGNISIGAPRSILQTSAWIGEIPRGTDEEYRTLILKVVESFIEHNQATVSKERLMKESQEMIAFEKALSELELVDGSKYYTSFGELIHWHNSNETDSKSGNPASRINWNELIHGLFDSVNIKVLPATNVHITNTGYVKGIGELLNRAPLRTIVNYIHWNFLVNTLVFTTEEMRELFRKNTVKTIFRVTDREPRWWECLDEMKMTHAAAIAFMQEKFTEATYSAIFEMINHIRIGLKQNINHSNWLDSESKDLLKEKLNSMKTFVAFPDWYNNQTAVINYYKGITIGADYFDNSLSYIRYNRKQILKRYITPEPEFVPFGGEEATSIRVDAFHSRIENSVRISAAIFRPPFFGLDFPNNINYAMAGWWVGHEMSHSFDQCGITFGKGGKKTELKDIALKSFYERVDCFIDQFDEYYGNPKVANETKWNCDSTDDDNTRTDGQKKAGENIADTIGLQATFKAYKRFIKQKYPAGEMRLLGLEEFTDDQLFFLAFAETWCHVEPPGLASFGESLDIKHSRPDLRVIGSLSNIKDFAEAFNCPIGSPMNPTNKCSIWNKPGGQIDEKS